MKNQVCVLQIAKVRVELNQVREELEESVKNQEFQRAAELKEVMHNLELERSTLLASAEPSVEEVKIEKVGGLPVSLLLFLIGSHSLLILPWESRLMQSSAVSYLIMKHNDDGYEGYIYPSLFK